MEITLRRYRIEDRESCLSVFRSNVPASFHESEEADFLAFVDAGDNPYFVLLEGRSVVGCGGYGYRPEETVADLCWGMIHSDRHGLRLGEYLLLGRLYGILDSRPVSQIRAATSQHTERFFDHYGFNTTDRTMNGFAPGLDEVKMVLKITEQVAEDVRVRWGAIARG